MVRKAMQITFFDFKIENRGCFRFDLVKISIGASSRSLFLFGKDAGRTEFDFLFIFNYLFEKMIEKEFDL